MARTDNIGNFCTDIADALREKSGTTDQIPADTFDEVIENLSSGPEILTVDLSLVFLDYVYYTDENGNIVQTTGGTITGRKGFAIVTDSYYGGGTGDNILQGCGYCVNFVLGSGSVTLWGPQ